MSQLATIKKFIEEHPYYTSFPSERDVEIGEALVEYEDGSKMCRRQPYENAQGNTVYSGSHHSERYEFDFDRCTSANGWTQYDTDQDAWYFGIWVHVEERLTFTYAEGDIHLVVCPTEESFRAELASMAEFYGPLPSVATGYDPDTGEVTKFYDTESAKLLGRELPAELQENEQA